MVRIEITVAITLTVARVVSVTIAIVFVVVVENVVGFWFAIRNVGEFQGVVAFVVAAISIAFAVELSSALKERE